LSSLLLTVAPNHDEAALDHAGVTFEWKDYGIKAATGSKP
jgi:hypothetical protein